MMLDIIMDYCYYRNFSFCRLDGSMNYIEREENVSVHSVYKISVLIDVL